MLNNKFIYLVSILLVTALSVALGYQIRISDSAQQQLHYQAPITTNVKNSESLSNQKISYAPFYSHIYYNNGNPILLEGTLSIRNTDIDENLNIIKVEYYDSKGELLKSFTEQPFQLKPLESIEYLVQKEDIDGGAGANFLVYWSSDNPNTTPIIESILIGKVQNKPFSFASRAIVVSH